MALFLLAYLAGVLTVATPCILPILPFVLARADEPFRRGALPMLLGLAVAFAAVASLASFAGGWAVALNRDGRTVALMLIAFFGLSMLLPNLAARVDRIQARHLGGASHGREGPGCGLLSAVWSRDGICVGALRGSDSCASSNYGGAYGSEHSDIDSAFDLRIGGGDLACRLFVLRRQTDRGAPAVGSMGRCASSNRRRRSRRGSGNHLARIQQRLERASAERTAVAECATAAA
jgi:hypothetical protein